MVGEVVICPASAEMGVEELVVHGALHLSGMDHGEDFEGSEMAGAQEAVMAAVSGGPGEGAPKGPAGGSPELRPRLSPPHLRRSSPAHNALPRPRGPAGSRG